MAGSGFKPSLDCLQGECVYLSAINTIEVYTIETEKRKIAQQKAKMIENHPKLASIFVPQQAVESLCQLVPPGKFG